MSKWLKTQKTSPRYYYQGMDNGGTGSKPVPPSFFFSYAVSLSKTTNPNVSPIGKRFGFECFGAGDRTRTGTSVTSRDFKSLVSTYSTTPAYCVWTILTHFSLSVKGRKGNFVLQITSSVPVFPAIFSDRRRNTARPLPSGFPDPGSPTERSGI